MVGRTPRILPAFLAAIGRRGGLSITFQHVFSCENNPEKRRWICRYVKPLFLFGDITLMHLPLCFDYISETMQVVDTVFLAIVGWSCKDRSRLNNNKKEPCRGCLKL